MKLLNRFKIWKFEKNRLEAFSDGVFAIIITLLVLEIKIPEIPKNADSTEFWNALKEIFPVIFSWVVSFLIVGTFWLQHHNILRMATKADYAIAWMNTVFLLFATLIPFPAEMMGRYPHIPLAVASLGIVMLLSTAVAITMFYYIAQNYLTHEYTKKDVMKNVRRAYLLGPLLYIIAIASAWLDTRITFAIYAIVPVLFILPMDKPRQLEQK